MEIDLRKKKSIFICTYIPNKEYVGNHLETLSKILFLYSLNYEKFINVGDFIVCVGEFCISRFCDIFDLKSLKRRNLLKNLENTNSIDLILTNNPRDFQNSCVIKTGLLNFHRMVMTVMKTSFQRFKP